MVSLRVPAGVIDAGERQAVVDFGDAVCAELKLRGREHLRRWIGSKRQIRRKLVKAFEICR